MTSFSEISTLAVSALLLVGCSSAGTLPARKQSAPKPAPPPRACPAEAPAPPVLPFQRPIHALADFWIGRLPHNSDLPLLDRPRIAAHNSRVQQIHKEGWRRGRWDVRTLKVAPEKLMKRLRLRMTKLRLAVSEGKRVLADGSRPMVLLNRLKHELDRMKPRDDVRVTFRTTPLRCYPTEVGVYEKAGEIAFDLMQCAQLRLGEPVRVLGQSPGYMYVWSSYATGWVKPADLTPPLSSDQAKAYLTPKRFVVIQRDQLPLWSDATRRQVRDRARLGLRFPLLKEGREVFEVLIPGERGLAPGWVPAAGVSVGYPPLSRRGLLASVFQLQNSPYGWGGVGGHRDCSRMMMDLFGAFGLLFPRNSWHQSMAGVRHVDVKKLGDAEKTAAIEAAAADSVMLLYLPGHIMYYLGRDGDHLYALHQFSGYLALCPGGGETMMRVNRTAVTSLELGRGSSRRSFLERITKLVLLGPPVKRGEAPSK